LKLLAIIIHDEPPLRNVIADTLEAWTRHEVRVERAGFETRLPGVWQRWLQEADLFVVGLERRYDKGTRAEGVPVAETFWNAGKKVLLVGSECRGDHIQAPFYWDIASGKSILQAVTAVLENPLPDPTDREKFRQHFQARLAAPTGHGPRRESA